MSSPERALFKQFQQDMSCLDCHLLQDELFWINPSLSVQKLLLKDLMAEVCGRYKAMSIPHDDALVTTSKPHVQG